MINSIKATQIASFLSPFDQGKYSGNISINILQDAKTSVFFIKVVGERISRKTIGFISLGHGYLPGESQSGLALNKDFQNMEYESEIALLLGALVYIYYINKFELGSMNSKERVKTFSASVKNSDSKSIECIRKLELHFIRPLKVTETNTQSSCRLYRIDGQCFEGYSEKFFNLNKITSELVKSDS